MDGSVCVTIIFVPRICMQVHSWHTLGKVISLQACIVSTFFFTTKQWITNNIVAAFPGMHVSPAKHGYVWLPRKCDYQTDTRTDGWTDRRQTKWSLCDTMFRLAKTQSDIIMSFSILTTVTVFIGGKRFEEIRHPESFTYTQLCFTVTVTMSWAIVLTHWNTEKSLVAILFS